MFVQILSYLPRLSNPPKGAAEAGVPNLETQRGLGDFILKMGCNQRSAAPKLPNCLPFSVKVSYTFSSPCEASGKVASARGVASARYPFGMMPHLREIRRAGCSGLRR
jgi:hypothetical protein